MQGRRTPNAPVGTNAPRHGGAHQVVVENYRLESAKERELWLCFLVRNIGHVHPVDPVDPLKVCQPAVVLRRQTPRHQDLGVRACQVREDGSRALSYAATPLWPRRGAGKDLDNAAEREGVLAARRPRHVDVCEGRVPRAMSYLHEYRLLLGVDDPIGTLRELVRKLCALEGLALVRRDVEDHLKLLLRPRPPSVSHPTCRAPFNLVQRPALHTATVSQGPPTAVRAQHGRLDQESRARARRAARRASAGGVMRSQFPRKNRLHRLQGSAVAHSTGGVSRGLACGFIAATK